MGISTNFSRAGGTRMRSGESDLSCNIMGGLTSQNKMSMDGVRILRISVEERWCLSLFLKAGREWKWIQNSYRKSHDMTRMWASK